VNLKDGGIRKWPPPGSSLAPMCEDLRVDSGKAARSEKDEPHDSGREFYERGKRDIRILRQGSRPAFPTFQLLDFNVVVLESRSGDESETG